MTTNGFIDTAMQKAFIRNVNGTMEHNTVLQEVISHARRNTTNLPISHFFDIRDAFGSISHSLIDHTLTIYNIPDNIKSYTSSLYSNISGQVVGNK